MAAVGEHAVVLGASMSGLLAARVLSDHVDRVTLVERDELPDHPSFRKGVPQARQPHGLLARGLEVLEELLPGLTGDLVARGALTADLQAGARWINDGHRLRSAPSGMTGISVSRPLLEDRVRAGVRARDGVDIRDGVDVVGLMTDGTRVTGARIRPRTDGAVEEDVPADLVVDATGRGSRTPVWLRELGYPQPAESTVEVGIGYTTRVFPRLDDDVDGAAAVIIGASLAAPRFGAALAMEGGRWMVTIGGYRGDHAPLDGMPAYRDYAASLAAPDIADLLRNREPLGDPQPYRFQSSARRHYERLPVFPDGLLVIGDALSSFNPVYAQGMTVAALEALALDRCLAEGRAGLAHRFFRRAARIIDIPWDMAVGSDLRMPAVPGPRPARVRVINAYVARVQAAAAQDAAVGRAFLRVANLLDRPETLMKPTIAARVLMASRRRTPREDTSRTTAR
jgi:2-polyprenyl-6-methoxyphenol hydroxylase-like FAD-dependent oxidoreductase